MKASSVFVVSVLFLCALPISSLSDSLSDDDFAIMRQRTLELTVWPKPENIPITVQQALVYSHTLNSSCYWPNINYTDQGPAVWLTATHMYRITTMVQALTVNGSSIQNDPQVMANVHCALKVWLTNDWQHIKWWYNEINIPHQATSQLLMLGDNATDFEIEKIVAMSYRAAWWIPSSITVGANKVAMIQVQIYRSLSTRNTTGIDQAFSTMWQSVTISSLDEEGIQNDWSYHFHGSELLNGVYGLVYVYDIILFLQVGQNTQYQLDDQKLSLFVDFLLKSDAWMIMTNEWDFSVLGRAIADSGNGFDFSFSVSGLRRLAEMIQSNETRVELTNFVDRLDNRSNTPLPIGNRHFYTSDYQVHRRANWIFTIKMQSIRTQATECYNGENVKDEHGGQGLLNLYRVGFNDYFDIFPLIDWQALNGITVEHGIPLLPCVDGIFYVQKLSFVGGVSDSQYGLAMMDTITHNLTAKRSWYFYDDAVIALATNLTLTTPTAAWTTLASRLLPTGQVTVGFFNSTIITLNDGNYSFPHVQNQTSNVQWVHAGESNIGYLLPLQQQYASLDIQVGMKTGSYADIGPYNSTVTHRMFTLWINHGVGPYTLDYNYMIVPNVSVESMSALVKRYDEEQVFACISTNKLFHGTMWPALKRAAFVLWDNVTTAFSCKSAMFEINLELSDAGAYLYSETERDFTLTASHPMRVNGTVKITVDRVGYGEGCTVSSDTHATRTNVTLMLPSSSQLLGASINVTCKKQNMDEFKTKFHFFRK